MLGRLILTYLFFLGNIGFAEINILAIGDSLTAGYHSKGEEHSPYTDAMNEIFAGSDIEINVDNKGMDSLPITFIHGNLIDAYEQKQYDITIFLGGTNDLSFSTIDNVEFSQENIIENLFKAYAEIKDSGSFLIGITIPPLETGHAELDPKREFINTKIKAYFKEHPKQGLLFDLEGMVSNDWDEFLFWDHDNIHFSAAGYQKMGKEITKLIKGKRVLEKVERSKKKSQFRSKIRNVLRYFI